MNTFLLADEAPLLGKLQADRLRREALETRHLHLELHAIDLADPSADGLAPALVEWQRELGTPLERRRTRLTELLKGRGGAISIARAMARQLR